MFDGLFTVNCALETLAKIEIIETIVYMQAMLIL